MFINWTIRHLFVVSSYNDLQLIPKNPIRKAVVKFLVVLLFFPLHQKLQLFEDPRCRFIIPAANILLLYIFVYLVLKLRSLLKNKLLISPNDSFIFNCYDSWICLCPILRRTVKLPNLTPGNFMQRSSQTYFFVTRLSVGDLSDFLNYSSLY